MSRRRSAVPHAAAALTSGRFLHRDVMSIERVRRGRAWAAALPVAARNTESRAFFFRQARASGKFRVCEHRLLAARTAAVGHVVWATAVFFFIFFHEGTCTFWGEGWEER